MNIKKQLPPQTYYYYKGSLTQPPCEEEVLWIILQDDILEMKESDLFLLFRECTFIDEVTGLGGSKNFFHIL